MSSALDNAKERVAATGDKLKQGLHESADRVSDKVDEARADAKVKQAEAERKDTKAKNEYKEELRDS